MNYAKSKFKLYLNIGITFVDNQYIQKKPMFQLLLFDCTKFDI